MGAKVTKPVYNGPRKRIIIVGASYAGDKVAKGLLAADSEGTALDILLIDKSEHFENFCGNFKMFVDDCFRENSLMFETQMTYYDSSNVNFKHGRLTAVHSDLNEIEIEIPGGAFEKLPYDVLVIATGGAYQAPWRAEDDKLATFEERAQECEEFRQKVLAAQKILCVGAGATGVEVAGYTKELYPDKTVGICHKGDKILAGLPDCHEMATKMLTELGIEIHHNTPLTDELKTKWDVVIDCAGFRYLGPSMFLKNSLAQCVDKRTGQILVNEHCQLTNMHPLIDKGQPQNPTVYQNIFSVGDTCLTRMNELKSIPSIIQYVHVPVENIYNVAIEQPVVAKLPESVNLLIMIPIGKSKGIFKFNKMTKEDATMFSQKDGLLKLENGARSNQKQCIVQQKKQHKQFGMVLGLAKGCCTFLPMHINKNQDDIDLKNAYDKSQFEKFY